MASGSFTGTTNNEYIKPTIVWSSVPNEDTNSSVVTATLKYSRTNTGYTTYGTGTFSLTINGNTKTETKTITITYDSNTVAITHTVTVAHNSDGTKSITISATGGIPSTSFTSTSISKTVTLDTIDRGLMWVRVSGTWRHAQPWVRVSGTWRKAKAYGRISGTWRLGL